MDESYAGLPTSHLLGSVPAVVSEDKDKNTTSYEAPEANLQIFPPNNGGEKGRGYQTVGSTSETFEQQPANNWRGVFNISSYTQYFNVDTDVVLNRLLSSLYPHGGDFFSKIDANPDLYGLIWISTTLVFVLAALGNCATYLMEKHSDSSTSWAFNFLLLIPVEAFRWIIIILVGAASSCFVAFNLKTYIEGNDVVVIAAFLLQLALAIFFKVYFFP
ncbi:protein YIPF1 homolog isoform X2 [Prunus dulcis]|uniref:protein YIPF1 homolog isoform X2 n=1 Tax=Prunus dulcis TaxID=3755 RepID=UPI001482835C|nr:protein YIPF1 homolog isoform X2 [Prunus dulcis]